MECREAFEWAGEIGFLDSRGKVLVVAEEEEIGTEGTNGGDEVLVFSQENTRMGEDFLDMFAAHALRFLRRRAFHAPDGCITRHKNEKLAAARGFPQEKHMSWMEAVEGAANEDTLHFFWRSMTYTLFSSRRYRCVSSGSTERSRSFPICSPSMMYWRR